MRALLFLLIFSVVLSWSPTTWAADTKLINPSKLEMFVDELPDMPRVRGFNIQNGVPVSKSITIGMFQKKWKFHRDLPATTVFAFGTSKKVATVPGPTIEALHGVETYVTWQNHLPSQHILPWDPTIPTARPKMGVPTVVHLHGGIDEPESDGYAKSWFTAGFKERGPTWTKKTYRYHNTQHPGNMWYHDHTMGLTRENILAGLIGAYILRHPPVEAPLRVPYGDEFDRPLIVFDRSFYTNGTIYMNSTGHTPSIHPQWHPEYFGNVIVVNGKAWPRMTVRRMKYQFRIINASNSRFFRFFFTNGMRFIHVGSDSAYLARPVRTKKLLLAPSEIAHVIVDFSKSTSDMVILANGAAYPYPSGDPTNDINGKVMRFEINGQHEVDTTRVPPRLMKYPSPDISSASTTRYISMYEYMTPMAMDMPSVLYLNGKSFDDPVTEMPRAGTTEIWNVINLTGDNHPLHIHLGLITALEQTKLVELEEFKECMMMKNDAIECQVSKYARGKRKPVPAHERGWKNVFKMRPGYVTKILVRFSFIHSNASYPFDATAEPGYVYHCHILDHEDNAMMRPLKLIS
nr:TPA_asm: hypothetical protein HUJ06_006279 [Nelumbo nucifera]